MFPTPKGNHPTPREMNIYANIHPIYIKYAEIRHQEICSICP